MKKYTLIIAILFSSYTINTAEHLLSQRYQEWKPEYYSNKMQITAFSHFLEINNIDIKNKRILSVGCGTGEIEAKLAQQAQSVLGIDASNSMIDYALKNGKKQ